MRYFCNSCQKVIIPKKTKEPFDHDLGVDYVHGLMCDCGSEDIDKYPNHTLYLVKYLKEVKPFTSRTKAYQEQNEIMAMGIYCQVEEV